MPISRRCEASSFEEAPAPYLRIGPRLRRRTAPCLTLSRSGVLRAICLANACDVPSTSEARIRPDFHRSLETLSSITIIGEFEPKFWARCFLSPAKPVSWRHQAPPQVSEVSGPERSKKSKILAGDSQLLHHGVQGRARHPETDGGGADHTPGFLEHADDVFTLHLGKRAAFSLHRLGP